MIADVGAAALAVALEVNATVIELGLGGALHVSFTWSHFVRKNGVQRKEFLIPLQVFPTSCTTRLHFSPLPGRLLQAKGNHFKLKQNEVWSEVFKE